MYKLNHVLGRIKPMIFPVEQQEKGQQIHINPGQLIFNSRPSLTDVFLNKLMLSLEKPSQTISEQMVTLHKSRWALSDMTLFEFLWFTGEVCEFCSMSVHTINQNYRDVLYYKRTLYVIVCCLNGWWTLIGCQYFLSFIGRKIHLVISHSYQGWWSNDIISVKTLI